MVHTNVFTPTLKAVMAEVGDVGVVSVAEPTTTVHNPVPTTGVFPASVAVVVDTYLGYSNHIGASTAVAGHRDRLWPMLDSLGDT